MVLSGDDALTLPMAAMGGHGVISVAANVDPVRMARLWKRIEEEDFRQAMIEQEALFPLFQALFLETNPAPCKAALAAMGMCRNELRLPLVPVEESTDHTVRSILSDLEISLST